MGSTGQPGKLNSTFLKQLEQVQAKNTPPTPSKPTTAAAKPAVKSPATKPSVVCSNPVATGFKLPSIGEATSSTLTKRPSAVTTTGLKPTGLKPVTAIKPLEGTCSDSSPVTHGPVIPRKPSEVARKASHNFNNNNNNSSSNSSGCEEQSLSAGITKPSPNNATTATSAADTEAAAPPWQSLVRKPKMPSAALESPATNKTSNEESEDRSAKVKSLKLAFEAASPTTSAAPTTPVPPSVVRTKSSPVNVKNRAADQPQHPVQPTADGHGPVAPSVSKPTGNKMQTAITADKKSYRKRPMPGAPSTAPPRKPAKPPHVDLSVYFANAFDEVYDDAATTLKSRESVVSQIEEYTEEEELRERQKLDMMTSAGGGDTADDEIYDDVGGANADEMDEIYEEI